MNIVVAMDSFKGSMSSSEAAEAVANGIKNVYDDAKIQSYVLADGGEGTVQAFVESLGGEYKQVSVTGPLGDPVHATYGMIKSKENEKIAIIEMAQAAGLPLLKEEERNPLYTTTYGVGELILDAIKQNCRKFIIGIGGSATNDGGIGMLQALGFELLNEYGTAVAKGAIGLKELASISLEHVNPILSKCSFTIACDVTNPLCGEQGCSTIFAPQKGATKEMVIEMDQWLARYANLCADVSSYADANDKGAGAAGGLGFALRTFLKGTLKPGIDILFEVTDMEEKIKQADLVITGEGKLDAQTAMGKGPMGVAYLAKKYGKPVFAFAGCVSEDASICNEKGIDAYYSILTKVQPGKELLLKEVAMRNMQVTVEQVFRGMRAWQDTFELQ